MTSIPKKLWISVADPRRGGRARRLCWYAGTSDALVAQAARLILNLPGSDAAGSSVILLRDADGDTVPLSTALPSGASFALVLPERRLGGASSREPLGAPEAEDNGVEDDDSSDDEEDEEEENDLLLRGHKRQRTSLSAAGDAGASTVAAAPVDAAIPQGAASAQAPVARAPASLPPLLVPTALAGRRPPPQPVVRVVLDFLDAFTQAIENDDNINFIPNTGCFALYALYLDLVADRRYHPKNQDAFYKMTSMKGKVDRQRVIRYYLHEHAPPASAEAATPQATTTTTTATTTPTTSTPAGRVEAVQYKPQGKGPLLRRYRSTSDDAGSAIADLVERAGFVASVLDLSPALLVAKYVAFVRGFQPISKAEYLARQ